MLRRRAALAWFVALVALGACGARNERAPQPKQPQALAKRPIAETLSPGRAISIAVDPVPKRLGIQVEPGTTFLVESEECDVDVVMSLLDGNGEARARADNSNRAGGYEFLLARADGSESSSLVVESNAASSQCAISLTTLVDLQEWDNRLVETSIFLDKDEFTASAASGMYRSTLQTSLGSGLPENSALPVLVQARILQRHGKFQTLRGDLEAGLSSLEMAWQVASSHSDGWYQAELLNDLGETLFHHGAFDRQESIEWLAIEHAQESGNERAEAEAWNNLGASYAARGLPSQSLVAYRNAIASYESHGAEASMHATVHNLGVQLVEMGRLAEGIEELEEALDISLKHETARQQGQTLTALASAHARNGAMERSFSSFELAEAKLSEASAHYDLAVALEQHAQWLRHVGRLGEARAALERSLDLVPAGSNSGDSFRFQNAYVQLGLGVIARLQNQDGEARNFLESALDLFDAIGGLEGRILSRLELARTLRQLGEHAQALSMLEGATEIIESSRANLRHVALRSTYLSSWSEVYEELISVLANAALAEHSEVGIGKNRGSLLARRAFSISERVRARALLDHLKTQTRRITSAAIQDAETELGRAEMGSMPTSDSARSASSRRQREQALATENLRVARIRLDLLNEAERHAAGIKPQAAETVSAESLMSALDTGTVVVAYSLGEDQSWLWRIDSSDVQIFPLRNREAIDAAARNFHELVQLGRTLGYRNSADVARVHLAQLIFPASLDLSSAQRVVVIPDGALHLIPFEYLLNAELPSATGRGLVNSAEVVHLPSASSLIELRRRRSSRQPASKLLAMVVDPVFERDDPRVSSKSAAPGQVGSFGLANALRSALGGDLRRLPGSMAEAKRVKSIVEDNLPDSALLIASAFDATRELVRAGNLSDFRVLHFATHGLVDAEDPALVGLVLSLVDPHGRNWDGLLRPRDLYQINLSADLVVLSACKTGLGQEVRGEGIVGLADGFFASGASLLVVSLWEVDDEATSELMAAFYEGLLEERLSPVAALRQARSALKRDPRWQSPAYWSAFVPIGDWQIDVLGSE